MARLGMPTAGEMTPEQQAACAAAAGGRRGRIPTPMTAWIRNPELAARAQRLGEALRFETMLEPRQVELAVLLCARHWKADHVLASHGRHARASGLSKEIVDAIGRGEVPQLSDERDAAILGFVGELLRLGRADEGTYSRALCALGERGLVELVALVGYYGLVSLTVNAFELGESGGSASPRVEPERAGGAG